MSEKPGINDAITVQTALQTLQPGMYTFHYVQVIEGAPRIPLALYVAPINTGGEVEFMCPEGVERQTLAAPGDFVGVNVRKGPAVIAVSKFVPSPLVGKVPARVRVERLGELAGASADRPATAPGITPAAQPLRLSLLGHIERRGDVTVPAGQWLGDPDDQLRLEGVRIDWPGHPEGVDLECVCGGATGEQQGVTGQFVGTRGKAVPIREVALRLVGDQASSFRLEGEAAFSDGTRRAFGDGPLVAAAGAYLVALRAQVKVTQSPRTAAPERPQPRSVWTDPAVTRIVSSEAAVG